MSLQVTAAELTFMKCDCIQLDKLTLSFLWVRILQKQQRVICVTFYCKLHKHNCTVTPAQLRITTVSGADVMHCAGPSACK